MKEDITNKKQNIQEEVINTNVNAKSGQTKCPKCGATDISQSKTSGKLRCNFCRHEFSAEAIDGIVDDLKTLVGKKVGLAASDIEADKNMVTIKCSSCAAEVVIDTNESVNSRCHWCRNQLSLNEKVPNGAVPDTILPFKVEKADAKTHIEKFVKKRQFFAHPIFKKEFTTENIMGVYLPYVVIDVNGHADFSGEGEIETRRYTVKRGDSTETRYDADLYRVRRNFDICIHNLTIESNKDKLKHGSDAKTNNVINAIMPFDIENCVKWDANYLRGYTSEKRDTNITELDELAQIQMKDIARHNAGKLAAKYDRGIRWNTEKFDIKGEQWLTAYLPVWLYSYQEKKGENFVLHYVATNARTNETMGSVPVNVPKLLFYSFLVEVVGLFTTITVEFDGDFIFLASGIIFYILMYSRYRNKGARHTFEHETKVELFNAKAEDGFIKKRTGLSNSTMSGANDHIVVAKSYNKFNK